MAKKYVIIHGHFYQPPRENPWIDIIERQVSAAPAHDWNERVYDDCYRPNAYSRLLDAQGAIIDVHNNYRNLSFNFGPTLFSWLEQRHIGTARRIVEADKASCEAFEGHGNAIAQVFNHIIMPLSQERDQLTQIRWAKYYFRDRFKRETEGMWLAETAINMETVRCLIRENIRFVVLSPQQAEAWRPLDGNAGWTPAQQGLDTRRPYRVYPTDASGNRLPGFLDVFFFNTTLSRESSFGDLLKDAHILGTRLRACFDENSGTDQAVILATDGETFGHHKPFGDMCIAYFFKKIAEKFGMIPVNFAYFLAKNPPRHEVMLKHASDEGTSWSCIHGVGRWIRDCGCKTGGEPSWRQTWRTPLREALRRLQEHVDREYEQALSAAGIDPWTIRDAYIQVIDDPSSMHFTKILAEHSKGAKYPPEKVLAIRRYLEAQKYMLYSFTSCAWFFSDISGIEATQNLAYAARALQLGIPAGSRQAVLQEILEILARAKSNLPGITGRSLFEQKMLRFIDHEKIFAFTIAVEKIVGIIRSERARLFRCDVQLRQLCAVESRLLSYHGFEVALEYEMTGEQSRWAVLVSHREWAELRGWVVAAADFGRKLTSGVEPEHWMRHPGAQPFTLTDIFQTSRENMAEYIHQNIFRDTYVKFSAWMQKNEQQLDYLSRLNFPLPLYCVAPLTFVYNQQWNQLVRQLEHRGDEDEVAAKLRDLFKMQEQFKIAIDTKESAGLLERIIIMELSALFIKVNPGSCERIGRLLNIVDRFKIPVPKHKMEDVFSPVFSGPIQELYGEVQRLNSAQHRTTAEERMLAEKRELLLSLVNFARRMNFNTDAFKDL